MNPRYGMMIREALEQPRDEATGQFLPLGDFAPRCAYCGEYARTKSGIPLTCVCHRDLPNFDPNYGGLQ